MIYELEFLGLPQATQDSDAICFRYYHPYIKRFVVGVYDGGLKDYGEALKNHLNTYYFNGVVNPVIDYVICSHPDQDHASGLIEILSNFRVNTLVMNRPWLYIDELFPKICDGRITKHSLEQRLRENFPYVNELEAIALKNGIHIQEGFQGYKIDENLTILSPSREFYLKLLAESPKTPLQEKENNPFSLTRRILKDAFESWTDELIREDVETSAENESSIILLGDMGEEKFLLTGDGGIRALTAAADYAERQNICNLTEINVHQIPHHGGRHNVSPSILNRILGNIVPEGKYTNKIAIVSVAVDSDHPKKMVTNAYIRRGLKVYEARSKILRHHHGALPERKGWNSATPLKFNKQVEDWDN